MNFLLLYAGQTNITPGNARIRPFLLPFLLFFKKSRRRGKRKRVALQHPTQKGVYPLDKKRGQDFLVLVI